MLRIIVEGPTASGKSAVAQLIAETLREAGVEVAYENQEHQPRTPERLRTILRGRSAEIIERQLARDAAAGSTV